MIHLPSASTTINRQHRRVLFSVLGVPWTTTRRSSVFLPTRLAFGIILAMLSLRSYNPRERLIYGVTFGFLTLFTNAIHILGHTIGGRSVGAPMDENLITETSIFTVYHGDQTHQPRRVHLSRALGGPLANLLAGLVLLPLWPVLRGPAVRFFTIVNLALGLGLLLPIPDADGEVIWRELFRS